MYLSISIYILYYMLYYNYIIIIILLLYYYYYYYHYLSQNGGEESSKGEGEIEGELSDMEGSQISLPRSYTLPREFKYHHPNNTARERERRVGNNKISASRFYLPSTNSSDGEFYLNLL